MLGADIPGSRALIRTLVAAGLLGAAGCATSSAERLQGAWLSERERTLEAIPEDIALPLDVKLFLEANLGRMVLVFDGDRMGVRIPMPAESPAEWQWQDYRVVEQGENSITIEAKGARTTYHFSGNCIASATSYGFDEYFCRIERSLIRPADER